MPWGTIVNVTAVIVGSAIGLLAKSKFPERFRSIFIQAIGLVTIIIGVTNALAFTTPIPDASAIPRHMMEVIFAILIGGLLGEWLDIEQRLTNLGDRLKARINISQGSFTPGLITAFLIFCVGPMTLMGALNEGIQGDGSLLYAKSILDGFMSIALASSFGIGVLFSAIPLFLFQGAITLVGVTLGDVMSEVTINQLTAVGGVLILGLGINLLNQAKLRIANLLPALIIIVLLALLFG